MSHNAPGSIGQNQSPGRVFKGKKMAGQYGNERRTIQNLKIIRVDVERNVCSVQRSCPRSTRGNCDLSPGGKTEINQRQPPKRR